MRTVSLLFIACLSGAARADDGAGTVGAESIVIHEDAAAARALEDPAFVTVVRVDHAQAETRSTAEVLAETVGVSVRSLGGLGSFASISMRGAPAGQTEILIDGVPLSRVAFSSVDIGSLDLGTFDQVEIYRGGVPVELGGAALGGAVNFVTGVGPGRGGATSVTVGGGSFGARRLRLARGDESLGGRLRTTVAFGYAGADGDFGYFDDNGTPLNRADDAHRERANNGYDQADVVARLAWRGDVPVQAGERFSRKRQGVAGPTGVQALHASLTTTRNIVDFHATGRPAADLAVGARGFLVVEVQHWEDPAAEVGLVQADDRYLTWSAGASTDARYALSASQRASAALEARVERFTKNDPPEGADGTRLAGALSLSDEIALGGDWILLPALRADAMVTRGNGTPSPAGPAAVSRDDLYLSPRLGARWRLTPAVTLKANLGRYFRPATVIELFGDRGFVAGNATLRPESGTAADLGFVISTRREPFDRLYLEVAGFATQTSDLIAFLPSSGHYARAQNLSDARLGGVEIALAASAWRRVALTASYTFLATEQRAASVAVDGKQLPGRPRHALYTRADVTASRALGAFADLTLVSGNFLDEGNLSRVPLRRFLGAGVRLTPTPGLAFTVEVRNLLDDQVEGVDSAIGQIPRAVADVLNYPLPGRALYAALDFTL